MRTLKGYKAHQDITFNSVMANIHNDNILHTQNCSKAQLAFSYLLAEKNSCSAMFSKNEFAIVSNLRFISGKNLMLSGFEHEQSFIT